MENTHLLFVYYLFADTLIPWLTIPIHTMLLKVGEICFLVFGPFFVQFSNFVQFDKKLFVMREKRLILYLSKYDT